MALFRRSEDDRDSLLKKLESRAWRSGDEKREWLKQLGAVENLRPEICVRLLGLKDRTITRFAILQLAGTGSRRTLDLLLNTLMRQPQAAWSPLMDAIHAVESPALPERLEKLLQSKHNAHRVAAVEILAAHPAWYEQLSLVRAALNNDEEDVRRRMVRVLGTGVQHAAVYSLLRDHLRTRDDIVRHGAIAALAENPDVEVMEEFFDLLPDEPPQVQETMIRGLSQMIRNDAAVAEQVMEQLLPLLAANDERIRNAAAKLLGSMQDKNFVLRRFMQWAKGIAFWLRDRAFSAIATVAENLAEAILELMQDEDVDVVVGATVMAGQCGDPSVVHGLIDLIQSDRFQWWVKIGALEMLARFKTREARTMLVNALEYEDLAPAAIACLAHRGDEDVLPRLIEFLYDERRGLRLAVIKALHNYKDPELVSRLETVALNDLDEQVRIAALELLDGLGHEGVAAAALVREHFRKSSSVRAGETDLSMVNPALNEE